MDDSSELEGLLESLEAALAARIAAKQALDRWDPYDVDHRSIGEVQTAEEKTRAFEQRLDAYIGRRVEDRLKARG